MFRAGDRPASVHRSFRGGLGLGALSRGPPATIPGRLADLFFLGSQDKTSRQPTPHTLPLPRHSDKLGEIRPLPIQVSRIPRHDHRNSVCPSVPHQDPNTEIPLLGKEVSIPTEPPNPTVAGVIGTHVIVGETGTPHEAPDALPPVASQIQLVHRERPPTSSGTPVPAGGQEHLLVDDEEPPPRGDALWGTPTPTPTPRTPPILGRVAVGVGSPPPRSISVGTMVRPGDLTPHQYSRDESSVPGTSDLPGYGHQPASVNNVRQLHGSSLRQQAGTIERPHGSPQPPQPGTSGGVVPTPTSSEEDHPHLGVPNNRPICNTPQCEASPVLLPDSRPSGRLQRRLLPPLYAFPPFHLVERVVARVRETPNLSIL